MKRELLIKLCLSLGFALCSFIVGAQSLSKSVKICFHQQSSLYDPDYNSNSLRLKAFSDSLVTLLNECNYEIVSVEFHASSSPDGSDSLNKRLSQERFQSSREALLTSIAGRINLHGDSLQRISTGIERWEAVVKILDSIKTSDVSDNLLRESALEVLLNDRLSDKEKVATLRRLNSGKVWNYLKIKVFPKLRISTITMKLELVEHVSEIVPTAPVDTVVIVDTTSTVLAPAPMPEEMVVEKVAQEEWYQKLRVGTNSLALGLLIGNISGEIDVTKNLSFYLPIYYSGLNYFTSTIKFRTFAIQPELRWNFNCPKGLFAGFHFGLAYFNLATDGNWRIQSHNKREPLVGGGLSLGYRVPLSKDKKWNVEFVLGAGAYRFSYDKFYNELNGPLANSVKKAYLGLDNAAVSFTYSFDIRRGRKK